MYSNAYPSPRCLRMATQQRYPRGRGKLRQRTLANAKDAMHNAIDALDDQRWLGEVVTKLGSDWG